MTPPLTRPVPRLARWSTAIVLRVPGLAAALGLPGPIRVGPAVATPGGGFGSSLLQLLRHGLHDVPSEVHRTNGTPVATGAIFMDALPDDQFHLAGSDVLPEP